MRTHEIIQKPVPIQYYPEGSATPLPAPPINNQDITSNAYYVYNCSVLLVWSMSH